MRAKEPIRPESCVAVKEGACPFSTLTSLLSVFHGIGGRRTQVHCSLADGSWSYQGNGSNPPFIFTIFYINSPLSATF